MMRWLRDQRSSFHIYFRTDKLKNKYEQELKEKELESGNLKNRL